MFGIAKQSLISSDFFTVCQVIPCVGSLLEAAPNSSGLTEKIGGLVGGDSDKLSGLAGAADGFFKLRLGPDMAGNFVSVIFSMFNRVAVRVLQIYLRASSNKISGGV